MSGAAFGLPLHSFHFQKNKKIYVFESDILHILLADSIISTAKRFREMKKLQFLKAGDYMKTITRAKYLDRIIELNGTPDIKIITGIRGKLADLSGQAGKIKAALTDEHNRNSVSAIWKELKYLLKHSRFRKIDTELNFALWEPSATGQALGLLAMFPAIYQSDIGIYPDFEADKTYVKGTFLVKGHIRLVHVLISGIRLLKERDIRNFIKKFFK